MRTKLYTIYCALLGFTNCSIFRKFMTLDDTDNTTLFTPLTNPPPKKCASLIQCAAYASYAMSQPNKAITASAFQYVGQLCTLGRTPVFDDRVLAKNTITDGRDGSHAVVGMKPLAANANWLAFFLFNEVSNPIYPATPGLTGVTQGPVAAAPWNLSSTAFTKISAVQTLEGQFAALAYPQLMYAHDLKNYSTMTVMLWYNSGTPSSTDDPLFGTADHFPNSVNYVILYGGGTSGYLQFRYSAPCAIYQSNQTSNNVVSIGKWNYLGFTYNLGSISLYVNGTLKLQYAVNTCGTNPGILSNMANIEIGMDTFNRMKGYIASAEMYDRVLTQSQIVEAMKKSITVDYFE